MFVTDVELFEQEVLHIAINANKHKSMEVIARIVKRIEMYAPACKHYVFESVNSAYKLLVQDVSFSHK